MADRLCTGQSEIRSKTRCGQKSQVLVWFGRSLMLRHCSTLAQPGTALGLCTHMRKARHGLAAERRDRALQQLPKATGTELHRPRAPACCLLPAPWDSAASRGRSCNTPDPIAIPNPLCFSRLGWAATGCSGGCSGVKQTPAKSWLALQAPAPCQRAPEGNASGAACGRAPACLRWLPPKEPEAPRCFAQLLC